MTSRRAALLVLLTAPALGGCLYDYDNPAEQLAAGQATGRVVADRTVSGSLEPFPGVSVSLKGAEFDQTTHESGRFVLLGLPTGRHTLLFRKGTAWSLERDVEVAFGRDGQPEGVDVGTVELRYAAGVEGTFSILPGNTIQAGVAVDERTGLTAPLVVEPYPDQATARFRFPSLGVGTHLVKVGAIDAFGGRWVGGPAPVVVSEADQTKTITIGAGALAARVASTTGRVRFRVQEVGDTSADMALVTATLVDGGAALGPFTPDSAGWVDETVPEGAWQIVLSGGGLAAAGGAGATSRLAATVPGLPLKPPVATAVVLSGQVAEVGSVYVVSDLVTFSARVACLAAPDCGGSACVAGSCGDYAPPGLGNAGAGVTFCAPCTFQAGAAGQSCAAGLGLRGTCRCPDPDPFSATCLATGGPPLPSLCDPGCGAICTPDGVTTIGALPGPTGCQLP